MLSWKNILEKLEGNGVAKALALSLAFHFTLFSVIELGGRTGLWKHTFLPHRIAGKPLSPAEQKRREEAEKARQEKKETEIPLVFVDVDPALAVPEPPKEARYYSAANSAAGNPKPATENNVRIQGIQEKVPKTSPNIREAAPAQSPPQPQPQKAPEPAPQPPAPQAAPLTPAVAQPAPQPIPKPPEPKATTPEPKGKPIPEGETLMAKATPQAQPSKQSPGAASTQPVTPAPTPPRTRPRTLAAAKALKGMPGETMQQSGGVRRETLEASLDVRATPFGAYDAAFIAAVRARWYNLLDERSTPHTTPGRVILEFRLTKEGRIAAMNVVANDVNETLSWICQRAVMDPAPYQPFPSDLRRLLGADYRDVRFTFHYN